MTDWRNDTALLIQKARQGSRRALGRLISIAENDPEQRTAILSRVYEVTGGAYVIGITGPPGAGKSTLTDKLAKLLLSRGQKVGVVAVDPSSPYSGGAILGDRIRMSDLATQQNVYIRSMGTRGRLGGLSDAIASAVKILDACGFGYILIETVGVGQSEVDIVETADTTIVVTVPGLGDDIQTIKAGILEIADILVVNKADRDGAGQLASQLEAMLQLRDRADGEQEIPIVMTEADKGAGVDVLLDYAERRWNELGEAERRKTQVKRLRQEIRSRVIEDICAAFYSKYGFEVEIDGLIDSMADKKVNPYDWIAKKKELILSMGERI